MAEPRRLGPLAHEPATATGDTAGIVLRELPLRAMVALRGDADAAAVGKAVKAATGCDLPGACRASLSETGAVLWMGPDEWLVVGRPEEREALPGRLRAALGDTFAAVAETGESRTIIGLGGAHARDLLAKGCTIDLHPRAFGPGDCVNTLLAKAHVTLHQIDDAPTFSLYVHRSFAVYLWRWMLDAALEYGVDVAD